MLSLYALELFFRQRSQYKNFDDVWTEQWSEGQYGPKFLKLVHQLLLVYFDRHTKLCDLDVPTLNAMMISTSPKRQQQIFAVAER